MPVADLVLSFVEIYDMESFGLYFRLEVPGEASVPQCVEHTPTQIHSPVGRRRPTVEEFRPAVPPT